MAWRRTRRKEPRPDATALDVEVKALRLLGMRDHAVEELRRKLKEQGFPQEPIDVVLERFVDVGYLDDERVAGVLSRSLARKNWGPMQIRAKLRARGFDDTSIEPSILALDEEDVWADHARRQLEKKFRKGAPELDEDERQKAYRHLTYRGFPNSVVREVIFSSTG
ncbi:MAG: regulatory protein RecX [Myxococcota bacterium]